MMTFATIHLSETYNQFEYDYDASSITPDVSKLDETKKKSPNSSFGSKNTILGRAWEQKGITLDKNHTLNYRKSQVGPEQQPVSPPVEDSNISFKSYNNRNIAQEEN